MNKNKKNRIAVWKEVIKCLIDNLLYANNSAAREIGKVWQWAFSHLEDNPNTFNPLQDENSFKLLFEKFLREIDQMSDGKTKNHKELVKSVMNHSKLIDDIPVGISREVVDALGAFGMFYTLGEQKAIDSPSKFPYTTALFTVQPKVLEDILKTKKIPEEQQKIIKAIAKFIPKKGNVSYFEQIEAAAKIERWFGFKFVLLSSTDVYERGYTFYKEACGLPSINTLTFSNTSGLWNPHERLGTREFKRLYGMKANSELRYKDGYRATNFRDGILNTDFGCKRIYLFNEKETWNAFIKARDSAKDTKKFNRDTSKFIEEVCKCIQSNLLCLASVKNFNDLKWPLYVTRVSSNTIMFSHRYSGIDLSHAIWCGLNNQSQLQRVIFKVIKELGDIVPCVEPAIRLFNLLQPKLSSIVAIKGEETRQIVSQNLSVDQVLYALKEKLGLELEPLTSGRLREQYKSFMQ